MGKEFIEYNNGNVNILDRTSKIGRCVLQYAKEYMKEKSINNIDNRVRDAVLGDLINYLNLTNDLFIYPIDLYNDKIYSKQIDPQLLLTVLADSVSEYLFAEGLNKSSSLKFYECECVEKVNINDKALVLMDFINYISKKNSFDKVFTLKELYEKEQIKKHSKEMDELKSFLEHSSEYNENLQNGESIDSIYNRVAIANDLDYVSEDGTYYYNTEASEIYGQKEMMIWDKDRVERQIYALAYAYAKMNANDKQVTEIPIIKQKIKEMKQR